MKVLFVTSEVHPFVKNGALSEVAYSLPAALRKLDVDVRIIVPKYEEIPQNYKDKMIRLGHYDVPVGWRNQYCGLEYFEYEGIPVYFVDNEYYFKRPEAYGYYDDGERFSYFSRAVLESIRYMNDFVPDIIHCNDWYTAVVPVLLHAHYQKHGLYNHVKTVFTIHNIKKQGIFPKSILNDLLSLEDEYFNEGKLEYFRHVSLMKGGINFADAVTTVSKTYAREIMSPENGEGLEGLLYARRDKVYGILNGIHYNLFNPATDQEIFYQYNDASYDKKVKNKLALQKELNLPVNANIPMIGIVSELAEQKGFDMIAHIIENLLSMDIQLVVLGAGEEDYQDLFEYYSSIYPSRLSSNIYFSDSLSRKIYAASDLFLMPSLHEPCGTEQMIAMRYGAVPIVRRTGGLKDTVIPYNEYTGEGTGFSFKNADANEMLRVVKHALHIYHNKAKWKGLGKNCMCRNNSWDKSAAMYRDLYMSVMKTVNVR